MDWIIPCRAQEQIAVSVLRITRTGISGLIAVSRMSFNKQYEKAIAFLKAADKDWARAIEKIGPCCTHLPEIIDEPYEALVCAICHQQLTTKIGDMIISRLKSLYPEVSFPTPENIVSADFNSLRSCGLSAPKIATVKAIAQGTSSGLVPGRNVAVQMDDEDLVMQISSIKGIGRWTVEMLLINSLGRTDILPADDFGIRTGYQILKGLSVQPKAREIRESGKLWSPYRTVASRYLWKIHHAERANTV